MSPVRLPTPELLARSPELAALDILDAALAIAAHALLAANPELVSDDWVLELPEPAIQACLAAAVETNIVALQAALDRYRSYIVDHYRSLCSASDPDF